MASLEAVRTAREQCSRFASILLTDPNNWRLAERVRVVNERRLDLEGQVIEEQAAAWYAEHRER